MTDIFSETKEQVTTEDTKVETPSSYVEQLVGEGKKFKSVEDLAAGKLEADRYISELTARLDSLKAEVDKQTYSKELLETIRNKGAGADPVKSEEPLIRPSAGENTTQVSSEDIESLVEAVVTKREQTRTAQQNVSIANEAVVQQYGDKAAEYLKGKATELNVTVEKLKEIASESPTAFFRLVGLDETKKAVPSVVTQSSVRADNLNTQNVRNFKYYNELRQSNKSLYYTPKVQNQMMADLKAMGKERFYS